MKNLKKKLLGGVAGLIAAALMIWFWMPKPLPVDLAEVQKGRLTITVDEQGKTRARDRYVVAAPVTGRISRLDWREGDPVQEGQMVARIHPSPLDSRELAEIRARVEMDLALQRAAEEQVEEARAVHGQAKRERDRHERLFKTGGISRQTFEQADKAEVTSARALEAARARASAAAFEVQIARARLLASKKGRDGSAVEIKSPVSGRVLKIPEKSERVVTAGTTLLVLGDATRLEVVIDLLSSEAVKVRPGMPVKLENWGGDRNLPARVRTVESQGFTQVSALGIEEQRVNVVADLLEPPGPLGDDYRVEARIVIWEGQNILKVPAGALFRSGTDWAVFLDQGGRARKRIVEVGRRTPREAEIVKGLKEGDRVISHPTNQIEEGIKIKKK
ncbi:MAG: efflux RND transporter periplasmic adaptor subunit [Deltaproteobacteria bacterium]|nr:efflux RND transporter periplasmic adaptor subunit [Deltaproteobacteria bacterium]